MAVGPEDTGSGLGLVPLGGAGRALSSAPVGARLGVRPHVGHWESSEWLVPGLGG